MRRSFKSSFIRSSIALIVVTTISSCATAQRGPLIETCLLDTKAKNEKFWNADCELKAPEGEEFKTGRERTLPEMHDYICTPADDLKALLEWARKRK